MKAIYDALIVALSTLSVSGHLVPVYFVQAPMVSEDTVPAPPYLVVWGPSTGTGSLEDRLDGRRTDVSERVGITCVAGTAEGVLTVQTAIRGLLCPDGRPTRLTVPGYVTWVEPFDSRDVLVDTDVTFAGTSSHPVYGVDIYEVTAVPLP